VNELEKVFESDFNRLKKISPPSPISSGRIIRLYRKQILKQNVLSHLERQIPLNFRVFSRKMV
jgi:hypothetical protein